MTDHPLFGQTPILGMQRSKISEQVRHGIESQAENEIEKLRRLRKKLKQKEE